MCGSHARSDSMRATPKDMLSFGIFRSIVRTNGFTIVQMYLSSMASLVLTEADYISESSHVLDGK